MPLTAAEAKRLERIENALIGNGHEGISPRMVRIEENLKAATKATEEAKKVSADTTLLINDLGDKTTELINELSIKLTQLTEKTQTHFGTEHLSNLIKKKEFWTVVIVGYIFLHIVATYVPNVWDGIMVFLNIPSLVIPIR